MRLKAAAKVGTVEMDSSKACLHLKAVRTCVENALHGQVRLRRLLRCSSCVVVLPKKQLFGGSDSCHIAAFIV